jgi:hypothetical protein
MATGRPNQAVMLSQMVSTLTSRTAVTMVPGTPAKTFASADMGEQVWYDGRADHYNALRATSSLQGIDLADHLTVYYMSRTTKPRLELPPSHPHSLTNLPSPHAPKNSSYQTKNNLTVTILSPVLRIFAGSDKPPRPYSISLRPYSSASVIVPSLVVASLSPRLCNSILVAKIFHWATTRGDARPFLNSSTVLLANLTIVELGTVCNKKFVSVRRSPIPCT